MRKKETACAEYPMSSAKYLEVKQAAKDREGWKAKNRNAKS